MNPEGPLRADVDRLNPDGTGATDLVKAEVAAVARVPFDDSIAESPHAAGNRISRHAQRAGFPWIASSMRLQQNIHDVRSWSQALNVDIQREWDRPASILQTDRRKLHRNMRVAPQQLHRFVYMMGSFTCSLPSQGDFDCGAHCDDEPGADNDGDVVELAADADVPPILDHTSATSSSSASGMADKAETQEMSLMREYLIACLRPGMFVSFPVRENDEDISPFFAQVLAIEPKVTTVDVCTPGNESMFLSVAVQPYDSMLPFGGQDCCAALTAAEVFIFQDEVPHEVDWGRCTIADRRNFLEWSVEKSVNDGCVALRTPKVLQPPADWSLLHSKIPTLSLLDALREAGWEGARKTLLHRADDDRLSYDSRRPIPKKSYYKCLLVRAELFGPDVIEFRSDRPKTYLNIC